MLDLAWNVVVIMDGAISMNKFLTILPLFIGMVLITMQPLPTIMDA